MDFNGSFLQISKGVIERKRRARINHSLAELKFIILSESKDKGLHSKLDKAEILERTLSYLQALQKPQNNSAAECAAHLSTYREGFLACAKEMERFLSLDNMDEVSKQKITNHLVFCSNGLDLLAQKSQVQYSSYATLPVSPAPLNYAMVPESPSPSLSGSYCYSHGYPESPKSEPVWRPW